MIAQISNAACLFSGICISFYIWIVSSCFCPALLQKEDNSFWYLFSKTWRGWSFICHHNFIGQDTEHPQGTARPRVEDSKPLTLQQLLRSQQRDAKVLSLKCLSKCRQPESISPAGLGYQMPESYSCWKPWSQSSLSVSQLGRKRFHLRQNWQKHSGEDLGLAEFGEALISAKSLSLPGSWRFQASPYTSIPELYTPDTSLDKDFSLCAALSHLPDSAPSICPFLPLCPLQKPPCTTPCLQDCRGLRRGEWRSVTSSSFSLSLATEATRIM